MNNSLPAAVRRVLFKYTKKMIMVTAVIELQGFTHLWTVWYNSMIQYLLVVMTDFSD